MYLEKATLQYFQFIPKHALMLLNPFATQASVPWKGPDRLVIWTFPFMSTGSSWSSPIDGGRWQKGKSDFKSQSQWFCRDVLNLRLPGALSCSNPSGAAQACCDRARRSASWLTPNGGWHIYVCWSPGRYGTFRDGWRDKHFLVCACVWYVFGTWHDCWWKGGKWSLFNLMDVCLHREISISISTHLSLTIHSFLICSFLFLFSIYRSIQGGWFKEYRIWEMINT